MSNNKECMSNNMADDSCIDSTDTYTKVAKSASRLKRLARPAGTFVGAMLLVASVNAIGVDRIDMLSQTPVIVSAQNGMVVAIKNFWGKKIFPATKALSASPEVLMSANGAVSSSMNAQIEEAQAKIKILEEEEKALRKMDGSYFLSDDMDLGSLYSSNTARLYLFGLLATCLGAATFVIRRGMRFSSSTGYAAKSRMIPEYDALPQYEARQGEVDCFDEQAIAEIAEICEPVSLVSSVANLEEVTETVDSIIPLASVEASNSESSGESEQDSGESASEPNYDSDYALFNVLRSDLPICRAQEVLDEVQQAKFWMDINEPQRAIDILESHWLAKRPGSPLPWLYLLDLYQIVGDRKKYEKLTGPFEMIFNGKAAPWVDHCKNEEIELAEEPLYMHG